MRKAVCLRKIFTFIVTLSLLVSNFLGFLPQLFVQDSYAESSPNGNGLVITKDVSKTEVWRDIPEDRLVEYEIIVENTESCSAAPIDVLLVMDRSGSMDDDTEWIQGYCEGHPGTDEYWCHYLGWTWVPGHWGDPQPLTDAKDSGKYFIDLLDNNLDYAGLVSYSTSSTLDQYLTDNHSSVKTAIDSINADGWTNIGLAIEIAHSEFIANGRQGSPTYAVPIIVLMTDGIANVNENGTGTPDVTGGELYAELAADNAKADGIRIIAIGMGDEVNEDWLRDEIATSASDYYYAPSSSDLDDIYSDIQATLGDSVDTVVTDNISDILIDADLWQVYDGGTFDSVDTITWDLGTLSCMNGSSTKTVNFSVIVHDDAPDGDIMENVASVTNLGGSYAESNLVSTEIKVLEKVDSDDPVIPGETFTYYIDVATGDYPVENINVIDYLDSNLSFIDASNGGVYNSIDHTIEWDLGYYPAHSYDLLTVMVRLEDIWIDDNEDGVLYNEASIELEYEDPIQLNYPTTYPDDGLIWVEKYTGVESFIDINISKIDDHDLVEAGELLIYEIIYENTGNTVAEDVIIKDSYDSNTQFVSSLPTPDSGTENEWTIGDLPPDGPHSILVTVSVISPLDDGTYLTNYVRMEYEDPTHENGIEFVEDYEYTEVNSAPVLTITKSDIPDPVVAGETISYTLTYENIGNMTAVDVEVTDSLPNGFTYVAGSSEIDGISISDPTGADPLYTWDLATLLGNGTLDPDGFHTITFDVLVDVGFADGSIETDLAIVTGYYLNQGEVLEMISSEDTEDTTIIAPVLEIVKTNNAPTAGVNPGDTITFTVILSNVGGANAVNTTITDTLPANVSLVAGSSFIDGVNVGDPSGTNPYIWPVGELLSGGSVTLTYDVIISADSTGGAYSNSSFGDADNIDPTDIVTSSFLVTIPSVLGEETGPEEEEEEGEVLGATGQSSIVILLIGGMLVVGSSVVLKKRKV